jgi:hypothetical protein
MSTTSEEIRKITGGGRVHPDNLDVEEGKVGEAGVQSADLTQKLSLVMMIKGIIITNFRGACQLFVLGFLWFWMIFTMQVGTNILLFSYVYDIDPVISTVSIITDSMDSSSAWPLSPPVSVEYCSLLITNPCKPPFRGPYRSECEGETLAGLGGFSTSVNMETLTVNIKPQKAWSSVPMTWQNQAWCNLVLVLSDDVDLEISGTQKSIVIAEHVRLKSLRIKSNGGDIWFQSKNLSISEYLGFQSPGGGVCVRACVRVCV